MEEPSFFYCWVSEYEEGLLVRWEDDPRPPLSMAEVTRRESVTTAGVITGGLACGIPVAQARPNLVSAGAATEVAGQAATGLVP